MGDAVGGTHTLVLSVPEPITVTVGALGTRRFPEGGYVYTGSALGPDTPDVSDAGRMN